MWGAPMWCERAYSIFLRSVAIGLERSLFSELCDGKSSICWDCGEFGWIKRIVVSPFEFRINLQIINGKKIVKLVFLLFKNEPFLFTFI